MTQLKLFGALGAAAMATLWCAPSSAQATGPRITQKMAEEIGATPYAAPRISAEQIARLAAQPDFQGDWAPSAADAAGSVVFDPYNMFVPYQLPAGVQEFGPRPGTYLTKIPYKPEYLKEYQRVVADSVAGKATDTYALCKPYGMPRFMGGAAVGFDLLQHPDLIIMQNWYDNEHRRIYLDGRPHPTLDPFGGDAWVTYTGHSVGHWEGDTLVIDTVNMAAGVYDDTEAPHSDKVHLVERLHLISAGILQNDMTIEDPVMFTAPWSVTRYYSRRPPQRGPDGKPVAQSPYHNVYDRPCQETIDMSKGYQSLILPQEIEASKKARKTGSKSK